MLVKNHGVIITEYLSVKNILELGVSPPEDLRSWPRNRARLTGRKPEEDTARVGARPSKAESGHLCAAQLIRPAHSFAIFAGRPAK
jgi:hypothetical protein